MPSLRTVLRTVLRIVMRTVLRIVMRTVTLWLVLCLVLGPFTLRPLLMSWYTKYTKDTSYSARRLPKCELWSQSPKRAMTGSQQSLNATPEIFPLRAMTVGSWQALVLYTAVTRVPLPQSAYAKLGEVYVTVHKTVHCDLKSRTHTWKIQGHIWSQGQQ